MSGVWWKGKSVTLEGCFGWLCAGLLVVWVLYQLCDPPSTTQYHGQQYTITYTVPASTPTPQTKSRTKTIRPYPLWLKGSTAGETRRVRLYVQRSEEGSALYQACIKDWDDELLGE